MSNIGKTLYGQYGYLGGHFNDCGNAPCRIEAEGHDWLVIRSFEENARPLFESFESEEAKNRLVKKWQEKIAIE